MALPRHYPYRQGSLAHQLRVEAYHALNRVLLALPAGTYRTLEVAVKARLSLEAVESLCLHAPVQGRRLARGRAVHVRTRRHELTLGT